MTTPKIGAVFFKLVEAARFGALRRDLKVASTGRPLARLTRKNSLFCHWQRRAPFESRFKI